MQDIFKIFSRAYRALHQSSYFVLLAVTVVVLWAFRPGTRAPVRPVLQKAPQQEFVLVIEKASQQMMLYCDGALMAIHPCGVGASDAADTLPGTYLVRRTYRDEHYRPYFQATQQGADRILEIGVGDQRDRWPPGYVVLTDADLERLAPFMTPGTRVVVR